MRTVQIVVVVFALLAAFIGGYDLCAWRAYAKVLPALQDSARLQHAVLSARVAAQIDRGEVPQARAKLMVLARIDSDPMPDLPLVLNWRNIFTAPLESNDPMIGMLNRSDQSAKSELSQLMVELCAASPDAKSTRYACNR